MSERSKTPTLKTMPEAPKAKVGPRVDVAELPALTTAPETPRSKNTPPGMRESPAGSKPPSVPPGTRESAAGSVPPSAGRAGSPTARGVPAGPSLTTDRGVPPGPRGNRPDSAATDPLAEPPVRDSLEDAATHVFDSGKFTRKGMINDTLVDSETYARIDPSELEPIPAPMQAVSMMPQAPKLPKDDGSFRAEVSTPIRAISMKTPGAGDRDRADTPPRAIPQVKLRAMADVGQHKPQQNLGYLAPPRDSREVRARRGRELAIWGSICVIIACAVALGIWFLAN